MSSEDQKSVEVLTERIDQLIKRLDAYEKNQAVAATNYVTRHEFEPVKHIVFGAAGIMLGLAFTSLVALVVYKIR